MSTLMLLVIFRATTLILFCSQREDTSLNPVSGEANCSGGANRGGANCSAASRYLVCLQRVSRLPLQSDAQLSDVDLQTSGEVL